MRKMNTGSWGYEGNYMFQLTQNEGNCLTLILGLYRTHGILSLHIRKLYGRNSKMVVCEITTAISRLQAMS